MPIFECNMAEVLEKIARDRYEEGYRVGLEESLKEPLDRINKLYEQLYD